VGHARPSRLRLALQRRKEPGLEVIEAPGRLPTGQVRDSLLGLHQAEVEEERYLSYSRDVDAVLTRVETGTAQAAFLLRPPAVQDVVEVAQAGQVMPQKSTYCFPKPASGIVFNPLDPAIRVGA